MENPSTQFIVSLAAIVGLLGFVIKLVLPRLLDKIDKKDEFIESMTRGFNETQNHKTTEMTNALVKLEATMHIQNSINQELIKFLKNGNGNTYGKN